MQQMMSAPSTPATAPTRGKRLVVTDHHANPPGRRLERLEAAAGVVGRTLTEWLMHLAVDAQQALAVTATAVL